ncbi:myb/SANT-like DNA-binding domain-containing protein 3 [Polyergus mexicanus]|uniref:myb/SANT-like DNA-binding domain-containing protein 3 n=1 Tax=Polyergus mexicanus TaxID=615972 RepID=UPI0038B51D29
MENSGQSSRELPIEINTEDTALMNFNRCPIIRGSPVMCRWPNQKKRERGSNFSNKEIELLVLIIQEFKNIIKCKKTDALTWRDKDATWEKVAKAFNSNSSEVFRSKKTLKAKYEDIKKSIKKKLAHNRMEQFKSGGGKPELRPLTGIEESILSMLPSSIEGLPSIWDSDQSLDTYIEMNSMGTNNNIHVDNIHLEINSPTRSLDTEIDIDFLMNNENKENNGETKTSDNEENNRECKKKRNTTGGITTYKETGVSILRKIIAPELRTNKRLKKMHQQIPHETSDRDQDMKEELHEIRMKILKKELEIKESQFFADLELNEKRLKAATVENEIRVLQKQIKEAELKILLKD